MRLLELLIVLTVSVGIIGFGGYQLFLKGEEGGGKTPLETKEKAIEDLAIAKAKEIYQQKRAEGVDFSTGPCIANDLMPDWVADIAHDPRLPIDDLPENQCSAFREGKVHHFIELDPEGNVIKVY